MLSKNAWEIFSLKIDYVYICVEVFDNQEKQNKEDNQLEGVTAPSLNQENTNGSVSYVYKDLSDKVWSKKFNLF